MTVPGNSCVLSEEFVQSRRPSVAAPIVSVAVASSSTDLVADPAAGT